MTITLQIDSDASSDPVIIYKYNNFMDVCFAINE